MRPEILAPAGDATAMRAAIRAGADAVYFGLQGFNARARAANFDTAGLRATLDELHAHGVKGYVTLNTLVFDDELAAFRDTVLAIADAGVDAVIVQDLGVARFVRALAPTLPIHASTQMTCTDASAVRLAAELGASRVVVARELSVDEIAAIRAETDVELEVFVHGALCVSYSGQCLTSEAIGGRSANRGACAQACRLPYDLVVDGVVQDIGDRAYLLSPGDLEASAVVPRLAELGVSSLKIEGRLKGPEYVAAATRLYREAVDVGAASDARKHDALVTYSRGSSTGFLAGTNHQTLVEAVTCEHRGVQMGVVDALEREGRKTWIHLVERSALARGDGVLVEGGRANRGEVGGRVWDVREDGAVWLGPDVDVRSIVAGRRIWKNDDPAIEKRVLAENERSPHRETIHVVITGDIGAPFVLEATSVRGLRARVVSDAPLAVAEKHPLDEATLRDKLGRLGDSPFVLGTLTVQWPAGATAPLSSLNRARRALTDALVASGSRTHAVTEATSDDVANALDDRWEGRAPPAPGLFVLCRTEEQATAALDAGADGVYLDFLALTGTSRALERLRARGAPFVGVAPPRIRKPGEEKIDRFLLGLGPDAVLVRGLGALRELRELQASSTSSPLFIGDFSLNVANRLAASEVLGRGLHGFTPSFDLNGPQLTALLATKVGPFAELVVHNPMPLFHTEHCVFAALLSEGRDFKSCGRPCEQHAISLRDRVGKDNPVEADVGCRNTVFHAQAQSGASLVPPALRAGCRRFRIELVREGRDDVTRTVAHYRALIAGSASPASVYKALAAESSYGVVRGSLRVLG
jgi:putative protease